MKDYYRILGVDPAASAAAIRRSWRRQSFEWHPDRNPARRAEAHRRFLELSEAWAVLGNPAQRKEYDIRRRALLDPPLPPWAEGSGAGGATGPRPAGRPSAARGAARPRGAGRDRREAEGGETMRQWRLRVYLLARDLARADRRGRILDRFMAVLWGSLLLCGFGGFGWFLWRASGDGRPPGSLPVWTPLLIALAGVTARVWGAAFRAHRIDRYWSLAAEILERAGHGWRPDRRASGDAQSRPPV